VNALFFAWRNLVRQPARAALGVLGVTAVGALLLDMLLLSNGLVISMRDLLDRGGWDIRVTSGDELPGRDSRITDASGALQTIAALPSVSAALALRVVDARAERPGRPAVEASFRGASSPVAWTVMRGRDLETPGEVVVNDALASALGAGPGDRLSVRATCMEGTEALPPADLRVSGIAEFPFETAGEHTLAGTLDTMASVCGGNRQDEAAVILVAATGDPHVTTRAIGGARADLRAVTNEDLLERLRRNNFSYFSQISTVLATVTVAFAALLIAVLLTVSVNQRLGQIAALRALGFSRARVVADILSESALIVGAGGALSLPLGLALAGWLDGILRRLPGIPVSLHFFVLEPRALALHAALLTATAILAALYPMRVASTLPIAATLRDEIVG
jgi:putative ABC transport system permease protein